MFTDEQIASVKSYRIDKRGPSKYDGICFRCGKKAALGIGLPVCNAQLHVETVFGDFFKYWVVQHEDCMIKYDGTLVHFQLNPDVNSSAWLERKVRELRHAGIPAREARVVALFEQKRLSSMKV